MSKKTRNMVRTIVVIEQFNCNISSLYLLFQDKRNCAKFVSAEAKDSGDRIRPKYWEGVFSSETKHQCTIAPVSSSLEVPTILIHSVYWYLVLFGTGQHSLLCLVPVSLWIGIYRLAPPIHSVYWYLFLKILWERFFRKCSPVVGLHLGFNGLSKW